MFARAVLAVSVLRKKSKKRKSNNEVTDTKLKLDFLGGTRDLETYIIPFKSEKDTLRQIHQMEQLNTKSIDQAAKSDALEHHASAKTDSSANGGKESLMKSVLKKDSFGDQNSEVDNEFCSSPNQVGLIECCSRIICELNGNNFVSYVTNFSITLIT